VLVFENTHILEEVAGNYFRVQFPFDIVLHAHFQVTAFKKFHCLKGIINRGWVRVGIKEKETC
jgi:hypothetical protein